MTRPGVPEPIADLLRHPIRHLVWQWNWTAAILSSVSRAALFFVVNLPAARFDWPGVCHAIFARDDAIHRDRLERSA